MVISREAENSQPSHGYISAKGATGQQVHMPALEPSCLHTCACTVSARLSGQDMFLAKRSAKTKTQGGSLKDRTGVWGGPHPEGSHRGKADEELKNFPS